MEWIGFLHCSVTQTQDRGKFWGVRSSVCMYIHTYTCLSVLCVQLCLHTPSRLPSVHTLIPPTAHLMTYRVNHFYTHLTWVVTNTAHFPARCCVLATMAWVGSPISSPLPPSPPHDNSQSCGLYLGSSDRRVLLTYDSFVLRDNHFLIFNIKSSIVLWLLMTWCCAGTPVYVDCMYCI